MMRLCKQGLKSSLFLPTSLQRQSCIRWRHARVRNPSTIRIPSKKSEIGLRAAFGRDALLRRLGELTWRRSLDTGGPSSYDQNRYEYETPGGIDSCVRPPNRLRGIAKAQRTHSQCKNSGARIAGSHRK